MSQSYGIFELQYNKKLPKFEEIGPDGFIWVPLSSVPIDEHIRVNSMDQPALKVFNLLTLTAGAPFVTDEQKYLRELALKHKTMGYFLLHYKKIFGSIGVKEYDGEWKSGRAIIFNAREERYRSHKATKLNLIYSKVKYPCMNFTYIPGSISDYNTVYNETYYGPESSDD